MRKIELTPLQNSIIWILEEAGEESLETIRATLFLRSDNGEVLQTALNGLQKLGFVSVMGSSVVLTPNGYAALTK